MTMIAGLRTRGQTRAVVSAALFAGLTLGAGTAAADEINIYTSRHYQTDEAFYEGFTKETGIKVNRVEGKGNALLERMKSEGANSPADIFITVDAGNLWRAAEAGVFQETNSALLNERVPANLRHPKGKWYGFSQRARVIYYNKSKVEAGEIENYEDLADAKWRGRICIRSSSNIYNLSLLSSIIEAKGEAAAQDWAKAVVANFARDPQGGDTDQIRAVAAGECDLAVGNSYYFARLMRSAKDKDKKVVEAVGVVFPNQDNRGTHVNISGAGVLKSATNTDQAIRFLEYMTSEAAQRYFADGNNEYPVVAGVAPNSTLASLGTFKQDPVGVSAYGENQPLAQKIFDRAGWK